MSFKTFTRSTSYYSDGTNEFPLPYGSVDATYDYPLLHIEGNKAILSFLQHDDDSSHLNPLEEGTCNGNIYLTRERNCIWTDEGRVKSELCVAGRWNDESDIEANIIGSGGLTPREAALNEYLAKAPLIQLIDEWMEDCGFSFDPGETYEECFVTNQKELRDWLYDQEHIEGRAAEIFAEKWESIVGPFVIPISYNSHYETSISVDSWDGDVNHLPDGVWVADSEAIENIVWDYIGRNSNELRPIRWSYSARQIVKGKNFRGEEYSYTTWKPFYQVIGKDGKVIKGNLALGWAVSTMLEHYPELMPEIRRKTEEYCAGVLKEVSAWASGDVWGCVTVEYENVGTEEEPEWEEKDNEACWGYIGREYAEEQIASDFECDVKRVFV